MNEWMNCVGQETKLYIQKINNFFGLSQASSCLFIASGAFN